MLTLPILLLVFSFQTNVDSCAAIGLSLFAIFMLEHVIVTISALIGFDKPSQFNDFSFIGV